MAPINSSKSNRSAHIGQASGELLSELQDSGRRQRGTNEKAISLLRARYDAAKEKPRPPKTVIRNLFEATGDPLALSHPDKAAKLYGMDASRRPNVALRKIHTAVFYGDDIPGLGIAMSLIQRRGWTAARAAQEAVVIAAERGAWIGDAAPAPFDTAVQRVKEAIIRQRNGPQPPPLADTGDVLLIIIPERMTLRDPITLKRMSAGEHMVPDDAFWRRRLADGDIALIRRRPRSL